MKKFKTQTEMGFYLTADFETCYNKDTNECRVWSWAICGSTMKTIHDNNIESFFETLASFNCDLDIYFHNLAFDGEFIISYLLKKGLVCVNGNHNEEQFSVLTTDMGVMYTISFYIVSDEEEIEYVRKDKKGNVMYKKDGTPMVRKKKRLQKHKIRLLDSLKKIPLPLSQIAKSYGYKEEKGLIDYEKWRPEGYIPTEQEYKYVDNDVEIAMFALNYHIKQGYTKMTIGSDCMQEFYNTLSPDFGDKVFREFFPRLDNTEILNIPHYKFNNGQFELTEYTQEDIDEYARKSYKGGWCYVNPKVQGKKVGCGRVYDVNSLYPSRMYYGIYPKGMPVFEQGEFIPTEDYPLGIMRVLIKFKLKPNKFPCIQLKKGFIHLNSNEWVESSNNEWIELTITSVDYELIKECYYIGLEDTPKEIENEVGIIFLDYLKFKAFTDENNPFRPYIDKFMKIKEESTIKGNKGMRQIAKLFLNNLYGKFGESREANIKLPYIDENNVVKYELVHLEDKETKYVPVACFCTAYARAYTIRGANDNYDRFCYADTDSIHITGKEEPIGIEVDKTKLGAWDNENNFSTARFVRQKTYMEDNTITCCGLKKEFIIEKDNELTRISRDDYYFNVLGLSMEEFNVGLEIENGKTTSKRVNGGIDIRSSSFNIR